MWQKLTAHLRQGPAGADRWQFVLFLVVGGLNTAFGYGCFALLLYLHLHYSLAALLSTILGVLFNFRTIGQFVFRNRDRRLLLRFAGVYVVVYGLNLLGLRLMLAAGIGPYWSGAIFLLPSALLSYLLQRSWVFAAAPAGRG